MKQALLAVGLMLMAGVAGANATWTPLTEGTGFTTYINKTSKSVVKGHPRIWSMIIYSTGQSVDGSAAGPYFTRVEKYDEFDCEQRSMVELESDYFDNSGNLVTSYDLAKKAFIPPETMNSAIFKVVCVPKRGLRPR